MPNDTATRAHLASGHLRATAMELQSLHGNAVLDGPSARALALAIQGLGAALLWLDVFKKEHPNDRNPTAA